MLHKFNFTKLFNIYCLSYVCRNTSIFMNNIKYKSYIKEML